MKPGEKTEAWFKARSRLITEYWEMGIVRCEWCGSDWALGFHHLDKRNSGKAKHTLDDTRLLCAKCHDKADNQPGFEEFNKRLKKLR